MAPHELTFFSLQFLITVLYLVQMLMFDGKQSCQYLETPLVMRPLIK